MSERATYAVEVLLQEWGAEIERLSQESGRLAALKAELIGRQKDLDGEIEEVTEAINLLEQVYHPLKRHSSAGDEKTGSD